MRPLTGRRFFLFMILLTFLSCVFLLRSYISVSISIVDVSQFFLDFLLFFFKVPYPETGLALLCGDGGCSLCEGREEQVGLCDGLDGEDRLREAAADQLGDDGFWGPRRRMGR